jgi:hypothetical protein
MAWPDYRLLDRDYLGEAEHKRDRLERLYHLGHKHAWDGREVLTRLLDRHGGVKLSRERRQALANVFSVIMWGELAAWTVSADLALRLEDPAAKMAATSQVFDEARHFYVMRNYLAELGVEPPHLDGYTQTVLTSLINSSRLPDKLLGMQLIVEPVAVTLFRAVAAAQVEPVLTELLPYLERDESRHVGLGVLYLPQLLAGLSRLEVARLEALQLRIVTLIAWGTHLRRRDFEILGIDNNANFRHGVRINVEVMAGLRGADGQVPPGVLIGSPTIDRMNDWAIDLFYPRREVTPPGWQRSILGVVEGLARLGDRALRWAA